MRVHLGVRLRLYWPGVFCVIDWEADLNSPHTCLLLFYCHLNPAVHFNGNYN